MYLWLTDTVCSQTEQVACGGLEESEGSVGVGVIAGPSAGHGVREGGVVMRV